MGDFKKVITNRVVTRNPSSTKAGGAAAVSLPNSPSASSYEGPSPIDQAGPKIQLINTQLDKLFVTSPIGLQVALHRGQLSHILMHHDRGALQKTAGLRIAPYSIDTPSLMTAKGVLVPLPYGFEADRMTADTDLSTLQLKEQAFGEKKQGYVFVPLHPVADLDELGHTSLLFDAIRAKLDRGKIYKLLDIDVAKGVKPFPVYRIVAIDIGSSAPISIGTRTESDARPLFRLRPQPTAALPKAATPTILTPETPLKSVEASPNPFSFGSLNVRGAHICFVVDGSGSMAELMLRASKGLDTLYEKLPAIAYPFVKLGAVTTDPAAAPAALSAMSVATLGQLRTVFAAPSFQGGAEELALGIDRCRNFVRPDPNGSIFKGIVVLTDTEAKAAPAEDGVYLLPLDGNLEAVTQGSPDILQTMFKPDPPPEPLAARLRKKGMADDRARQVADVMASLEPVGADKRSALYAKLMRGWQEIMTAVMDVVPSKIIERLASRHAAEQPERVTQFAVAALRLMPTDVMSAQYPNLLQILKEDHDDKLKQETTRTVSTLLHQVSHEDRAALHLAQLRRNPNGVAVADILDCGRTPSTLRALLHVIRYGRDDPEALKALLFLYSNPPVTADERSRIVEALAFRYATAVHGEVFRYEAAANALGISLPELKGDAP